MNWTLFSMGVGLVCSFFAYGISVHGFFRTFKLLTEEGEEIEETIAKPTVLRKVGDSLRSAVISLIIATAILYFTVIGATVYTYSETHTTTTSICALRSDLESRTESGKKFLKEHPRGFAGISPATIAEQIHNQERSIRALSGLSC